MINFAEGVVGTIAAVAVVFALALGIARWLSRPIGRGRRRQQ